MKKLFIGLLLCVACNTKTEIKKDTIPDPEPADASCAEIIIEGSKAKVKLSNDWESMMPSTDSTTILARNSKTSALLSVNNENFNGDRDDYILQTLRIYRNKDVSLSDFDTKEFSDVKFVKFEVHKEDLDVWHYVGTKDKQAFVISCGGPRNDLLKDSCEQAINSIELK